MKARLLIISSIVLLSAASCTQEVGLDSPVGGMASLKLNAQIDDTPTRCVYAGNNTANWTANEQIGVAATKGNTFTDAILQPFTGDNESAASKATFTGTLTDGGAGTYTLYAVSPFAESSYISHLTYTIPCRQNPELDGWDPACDLMLGQSAEQTATSSISEADGALTFAHKVGWLVLSFSGFDCASEKVEYVRVSSSGNPLCGTVSINLTGQSISPVEGSTYDYVLADYIDSNVLLSDINAYLTLLPGTYSSVEIAVKTSGHYITLSRSNLTIRAGELNYATVTKAHGGSEATNTYPLTTAPLPSKSTDSGELNVLLLGHSFGQDCIYFIHDICKAAGIENAYVYLLYDGDCSLKSYFRYLKTREDVLIEHTDDDNQWRASSIYVDQAIEDTKWDVVIFQQSTATGSRVTGDPPYIGAADYSTYQPYLSYLMEYVVNAQRAIYGSTPHIAWNMIRSYNTGHETDRDSDYTTMYNAIVSATQSMASETGIKTVIPCGTAMMKARVEFPDSKYKLLLRDGWHASYGMGRYLEACTVFESIIAPIYGGNTTVQGNSFRPVAGDITGDDTVDDTKAGTLQQCAIYAVANNPVTTVSQQ